MELVYYNNSTKEWMTEEFNNKNELLYAMDYLSDHFEYSKNTLSRNNKLYSTKNNTMIKGAFYIKKNTHLEMIG
jgi:hypothetical protein